MKFLIFFLAFIALVQADVTDQHRAEVSGINSTYEAVDAYLDSFSPALNADVKAAASESIKAGLLTETKEQARNLVSAILLDIRRRTEEAQAEAKRVERLLAEIAEINLSEPGAIVVPNNATGDQLQALITAYHRGPNAQNRGGGPRS
jgi:hypothetical protein